MVAPLTSREIARLRVDAEESLCAKCTIVSRTYFSNGAGGMREATDVLEDVPCAVLTRVSGQGEAIIGGATQGREEAAILLPVRISVANSSQIIVDEIRYEILNVDIRTTQALQKVEVRRIDG